MHWYLLKGAKAVIVFGTLHLILFASLCFSPLLSASLVAISFSYHLIQAPFPVSSMYLPIAHCSQLYLTLSASA